MAKTVYRTCPECGTTVANDDYCPNCGALVNAHKRRKQERERQVAEKRAKREADKRKAGPGFFERAKEHKSPFVRFGAKFFYSIWIVVIAIGAILAIVIGYIAA